MGIWKNSSRDPVVVEADICRFSVLVSMTSRRIGDDKWVQAVYQCLGDQSLPIRKIDQGSSTWIQIFLPFSSSFFDASSLLLGIPIGQNAQVVRKRSNIHVHKVYRQIDQFPS